ncbi:MAG: hypothetical protein FJ033_03585 [Chloroflexi bacterium]|nr:hypothetical protein [Chloroflexota bacterium]
MGQAGLQISDDTRTIIQETLAEVTPRAAALALLRFGDYLELIQRSGVEMTEDLCSTLFQELRAICLRDQRESTI